MKKTVFTLFWTVLLCSCPQYTFDNPVDPANLNYSAPSLTVEKGKHAWIRLEWQAGRGNTKQFHIYRGLTADQLENIAVVDGNTNFFEDRDITLKPGKKYYYAVEALLAGKEFSERSNIAAGYVAFSPGTWIVHDNASSESFGGKGAKMIIDFNENILIAGYSIGQEDSYATVWRFTPEGQPDLSFNNTGYRTCLRNAVAYGITMDQDGAILVCGICSNENDDEAYILKLNQDGSPDLSFQDKGLLMLKNTGYDSLKEIRIDRDGKILVAGIQFNGVDRDMVIRRFNPDGSPDTFFNGTGFVSHHNAAGGNGDDISQAMILDQEDRIVVVGYSTPAGSGINGDPLTNITIWRYLPDGEPDANFGAGGFASYSIGYKDKDGIYYRYDSIAYDVEVDKAGRIITVGYIKYMFISDNILYNTKIPTVYRFKADGSYDENFNGGNGLFTFIKDNYGGNLHAVAVDEDDNIYAGGSIYNATDSETLLFKLLPGGSLDRAFASSGYICNNDLAGGTRGDEIENILLDKKGHIFCSGNSFNGTYITPVLIKYSMYPELQVNAGK